ncbi:MAG: DUF5050 domain-containing protein [Lachnospiraceae bacterium]|nr:DUF5050 domain-containing protein [Lachnospiraceae bacterium]
MKKKAATIVPVVIIFLILTGLFVYTIVPKKIENNPPNAVGNTAGNLNNGGYFVQYGDKVFFSNPYDNQKLYSMNKDETDVKKISNVRACNLLAGSEFVYYFQKGSSGESGLGGVRTAASFNKCRHNGKGTRTLTKDIVINGQLVGNTLYLMTNKKTYLDFYKMSTDKSNQKTISEYEINPSCANEKIIYYYGTAKDHRLYSYDTETEAVQVLTEFGAWYPAYYNGYIYYLDIENDYRLCRYNLSSKENEVVVNERIDNFNIGDGYLYCLVSGKNPALMCYSPDGSNPLTVASGVYKNLSMTSEYVYFTPYDNEESLYHAPLGSTSCQPFTDALKAATSK